MIKFEDIATVYSGKRGCMCGCRGKYHDASHNAKSGRKVSDATVRRIIKTMNSLPNVQDDGECFYVETETRNYVAYKR